ncbi:uncharacterized protein LOC133723572 isoform X2 [Rosa rugosa]|uniref:uncharacterized protein LOC133723572 isoform X2 n=1 Tax=Rosa rugosa TaxID=74645 RepID=UPI002B410EEB|nr:uncharacterized protein LOC133723572 isoform X2 [Rosa rugosa]
MGLVIHQIEFGFLLIILSRQDYEESMQRSIWIILLPLFLVLLLGVSLVSYCCSDIGNSERSKSTNFLDSVMASTRQRNGLKDCWKEDVNVINLIKLIQKDGKEVGVLSIYCFVVVMV